jgi:hypothetical protein
VTPNRVLTQELFEALDIAKENRSRDKEQRLRTVMESRLGWHHRRAVRVLDKANAGYTREKLKAWKRTA